MSVASSLYGAGSVIWSNLFITLPYPTSKSSLTELTMIVTGANTGLGLEASRHLLRLGVGKLIMAVRNLDKGEKARSELLQSTGRAPSSVEVWPLDMDSFDSVKAFAARCNSTLPRLDAVLANAGIATETFQLSDGECERTITVNVVSVFLLFFLLLPKLRVSPFPGMFVIPNSALHYTAPIKELCVRHSRNNQNGASDTSIFSRLNDSKTADMASRYPVSKLLVLYVVRELASRLKASDPSSTVAINTPNPSYCHSELMREMDYPASVKAVAGLLARSTEMGSRSLVHGVLAGPESNGQYLNNCKVSTPASHVTNKIGAQIQKAFFEELMRKLETISPGVTEQI